MTRKLTVVNNHNSTVNVLASVSSIFIMQHVILSLRPLSD